jgi:hypothetical protein
MSPNDNNHQKTSFTDSFLDAFALGVQAGLGLAGDPCAANGACPPVSATAAPADQRPIAGDDDELTAAERDLTGDQQQRDLGDDE